MLRFLFDVAVAVVVPGGLFYGGYRLVKYVRSRQRERRIQDLTYAAIMDAANAKMTDQRWIDIYRQVMQEPETIYDDVQETGWKQRVMLELNRRWPRA